MTSSTKTVATQEKPIKAVGGIYKKILEVQKKVDSVPKRGYNSFHKYHYATEADILTVKQTLNENSLLVLPTTLHEETGFKPDGKNWASVTLLFKVVDADSGEFIESQFTGYAEDTFDKAIYKATTGANKYFYLKFFGIATEDDPEREDNQPLPSRAGTTTQPVRASAVKTPANSGGDSSSKSRGTSSGERTETSTQHSGQAQRNQALVNANKILALQKQYGLSNEEVMFHGEINSIRDLAEEGNADLLAEAYLKLANHVRLLKAI